MSCLHRLDSAAYDTGWDLVSAWIRNEPLPFFRELRAKPPILPGRSTTPSTSGTACTSALAATSPR